MLVAKDRVVTFHYTLADEHSAVFETSLGRAPLSYIHGAGAMMPGLDRALAGLRPRESKQVWVSPEDAFGPRHDELVQTIPKHSLGPLRELRTGMRIFLRCEGRNKLWTITKIEGDEVTVDGNHPLAGARVHVAVEVLSVRQATLRELREPRPRAEISDLATT